MTHHKDEKHTSYELQTIEQPKKQRKKPNGWLKPFVSGIVGGTLALGVYVLTPYAQHSESSSTDSSTKTAAVSTNDTSTSTSTSKTTASQTSNSTSSISNMVENVSPAIVGITNYQTQSQTTTDFSDMNTPFDESQQNQNSSSQEQESGTGSGVIFKKSGSKAMY